MKQFIFGTFPKEFLDAGYIKKESYHIPCSSESLTDDEKKAIGSATNDLGESFWVAEDSDFFYVNYNQTIGKWIAAKYYFTPDFADTGGRGGARWLIGCLVSDEELERNYFNDIMTLTEKINVHSILNIIKSENQSTAFNEFNKIDTGNDFSNPANFDEIKYDEVFKKHFSNLLNKRQIELPFNDRALIKKLYTFLPFELKKQISVCDGINKYDGNKLTLSANYSSINKNETLEYIPSPLMSKFEDIIDNNDTIKLENFFQVKYKSLKPVVETKIEVANDSPPLIEISQAERQIVFEKEVYSDNEQEKNSTGRNDNDISNGETKSAFKRGLIIGAAIGVTSTVGMLAIGLGVWNFLINEKKKAVPHSTVNIESRGQVGENKEVNRETLSPIGIIDKKNNTVLKLIRSLFKNNNLKDPKDTLEFKSRFEVRGDNNKVKKMDSVKAGDKVYRK